MTPPHRTRSMLDWLEHPSPSTGICVANETEGSSFTSYAELAQSVKRAATEFAALRLARNDVVTIVSSSTTAFLTAFFAAIHVGAVPSPAGPPLPLQDRASYVNRLSAILASASPAGVIADEGVHGHVEEALANAGISVPVRRLSLDAPPAEGPARSADIALLQFTSGSSTAPRGVPITFENLESQLAALFRWIRFDESDAIATWLPLHHDMGLVGSSLEPVVYGVPLYAMRPDQFVRSPVRFLEWHGKFKASVSASPNFGFAYMLRRVEPGDLEGMDFSTWRFAITGAEPIDPAILRRFSDLLAPHGFTMSACRPAYGLAEATLAVTGHDDRPVRVVRPDWHALEMGAPVTIDLETTIDDPAVRDGVGWLVSCGRPLDGIDVTIIDEAGRTLQGALGEVAVRGPSVAEGYRGGPATTTTRFLDGELRTGDAGFLLDDELFLLGRIVDSVKVRGRHVYAEDLEAKAAALLGLSQHRVVAVLGVREGRPTAGLVVASELDDAMKRRVDALMRREVGDGADTWVQVIDRDSIPRTSSGKVRRRELWSCVLAGAFDGSRADAVNDAGGTVGVARS